MAYYAKISNEEFTISERARLIEAEKERSVIEDANTSTSEYQSLVDIYLESMKSGGSAEQDAFNNLQAKKNEGTEALASEIETLNTTIANSIARVTEMKSGVDEFTAGSGEVISVDNTVYWEEIYGGCKRTSYNTKGGVHTLGGTPFRKNYAAVGYIYDPVRDAFYTEQPYASWTLDESTCYWQPPTPMPEGRGWYWKEDTTEWVDYYWQEPPYEKPFPSWTYDGVNWIAPVEYPSDGNEYWWNEEIVNWESIETYGNK